jgi:hypothetical protein
MKPLKTLNGDIISGEKTKETAKSNGADTALPTK